MGGVVLVVIAPFSILLSERSPWWAVIPAMVILLGLALWRGHKGWRDEEMATHAALVAYGVFFLWHLIDKASGDGQWSFLEERNLLLYSWSLVAYMAYGAAKENRDHPERAKRRMESKIAREAEERRARLRKSQGR
ncbi:hypothetical protein [Streptomyces sp. AMCC400023]|uniref:hypothetical protein n=1 Tax=Streptomyces sp. AMCC400023 TaxID=2056258 RepID=UPI001F4050DB|nr:hypothetical protein [Streptomyces sp. AMCC400023]